MDEEFVSSYSPAASIEITTGDPYTVVPRTRVDQPFEVRIRVGGLQHGNGAPAIAGQVLLTHAGGEYPEGTHGFSGLTQC